jgi:signal transduction histidine kinase
VLENAVQGVARALDADQCAIAFPVEDDPSQMYLSAIYNPDRPGRGETITFPLEFQLAVQHAMRRKRHMIVEESDNVQLRALFGLLGASGTGPLLVQPLLAQGEAIGAIIVGNARSHRPFTPNEAKLCRSLSEQLVNAIQNTRHYRTAQQRIEELSKGQTVDQQVSQHTQELTSQLEEMEALVDSLREARHDLETKLVSSRAEAETLAQRLATLENILASQRAQWHGTLQAMLPGMAAGVLVADENGIVQGTNVAAEILLERDGTDLQGLDLIEISDDEEWRQAITSAQRGEAAHLALSLGPNMIMCDVAPLPQDDGLSSSDASLLADEGTSQGIVVVLQGLSSEAETQRARLETIASMTEELRSPMSTVIGYTDLLLSEAMGGVASAQRKFLLRIKADAERLVQIINDLAREAGSEEGWTHPVRQMVDMNELVEDALSAARTQFETKSLTVDLELAEDLPTVGADPNYVQRVVSCLLSNAALASPVGSEIQVLTAHLGVASPDNPAGEQPGDPGTNGFVRVSVQDNGDGLPHEALGQVFERTRPSQTPSGLGESGAGLALARTMIEAHGGRLWAESTEGRGTTFAFVLPADGQSAQQSTGHPVAARHGASSPMAVPG